MQSFQDIVAGERESGQDVRTQNVTAVQAVANIVKTSLGPVGLDKVRVRERIIPQACADLTNPPTLVARPPTFVHLGSPRAPRPDRPPPLCAFRGGRTPRSRKKSYR